MDLFTPDQLRNFISIFEENISLAKSILENDLENEDLKKLLKSQEESLKNTKST